MTSIQRRAIRQSEVFTPAETAPSPNVVRRPIRRYRNISWLKISAIGGIAIFCLLAITSPSTAPVPNRPTARPIVVFTMTPTEPSTYGPVVPWTPTPAPTTLPTSTPTATSTPTNRDRFPAWLDDECASTMSKILWQELRGSENPQAFEFLTAQLVYRAEKNGACDFRLDGLVQWRGYESIKTTSIPVGVSMTIQKVASQPLAFPFCQYVVSWAGVQVMINKGYIVDDLPANAPGLEVYGPIGLAIGLNCTPG